MKLACCLLLMLLLVVLAPAGNSPRFSTVNELEVSRLQCTQTCSSCNAATPSVETSIASMFIIRDRGKSQGAYMASLADSVIGEWGSDVATGTGA